MVEHPGEYRWSSYSANAQGALNETVYLHDEYRCLGTTSGARQAAYRELFGQLLDSEFAAKFRDTVTHELVVGTSRFKDEVEAITNRRARMGKPGRPSKEAKDRQQQ